MFVLMMQGYPISAKLPEDLGFGERFWYWRGASGQSYIHSIYASGSCPPLPGAIFLVVRNVGNQRIPISVGRFPGFFDIPPEYLTSAIPVSCDGDEIHVHLLARDAQSAECVLRDLERALRHDDSLVNHYTGFSEASEPSLLPA